MSTILAPLIAAVLQASSFTLDKVILNIRRISYKTYVAISFPLLFVANLIFWLIFRPALSWDMIFSTPGVFIFISAGLSIVTNILFYRALKHDHLSEINVISLATALPVILVNSLTFTDERNPIVLIAAVVATSAILWSHWDRHHFHFAKKTPVFLWWIMFSAPLGAAISKTVLVTWHPISMELIRHGMIALVLGPLYFRSIRQASARGWYLLLVTNTLSASAWILYFIGYQRLGIVQTGLIFSLEPLLVYFAAVLLLKEQFVQKKFIAFLIILASIASAQVLK